MPRTEFKVKTQSWLMRWVFAILNSGVVQTALRVERFFKATLAIICLLFIIWSFHCCRLVQEPPVDNNKNAFVVAQLVGVAFAEKQVYKEGP